MLAFTSGRMKALLLITTITSGVLALALATADFSVAASERATEVARLQGEVRALLGRIGEVEQSLLSVAKGRDHLIDLSRDGLATIINHTGIDPAQHGAIYAALLQDPAPAALPALTTDAPLGERVQAVKVTAALLSQRLGTDTGTMDARANILAVIPSILPAKGYISSEYGMRTSPFHNTDRMHNGIDVAADVGTLIVAPADGVVRYASTYGGYGNFVRIDHGHGIETRFAHADEMFVKKGDKIERGAPIATIGMTGRTTGPHLHYEIYVHGKPVDPARFLFATDSETLALARTPRDPRIAATAIGGDSDVAITNTETASLGTHDLVSGVSFDLADAPQRGWLAQVMPARLSFLNATDLAMIAALLLLIAVAGAVMPARAEAGARRPAQVQRRSQHHGFSGGWTVWGKEEGDDEE